jgi:hypothetical protein
MLLHAPCAVLSSQEFKTGSHLTTGVSFLWVPPSAWPICCPGQLEDHCEVVKVGCAGYASDVVVLAECSVQYCIYLFQEVVCALLWGAMHDLEGNEFSVWGNDCGPQYHAPVSCKWAYRVRDKDRRPFKSIYPSMGLQRLKLHGVARLKLRLRKLSNVCKQVAALSIIGLTFVCERFSLPKAQLQCSIGLRSLIPRDSCAAAVA